MNLGLVLFILVILFLLGLGIVVCEAADYLNKLYEGVDNDR